MKYSDTSIPQRWQWHAEVYALRRVLLGVRDTTSPPDPKGVWYDEAGIARAEAELRARIAEQSHRCQSDSDARNTSRYAEADACRANRDNTREAAE